MWPRLAIVAGLLAGVATAALLIGGVLTLAPEPAPSTTPVPTLVPTAVPEPSPSPQTPSPVPSAAPSVEPSSAPSAAPTAPVGGEGRIAPDGARRRVT
jgi:hypothetical protein